MAVLQFRGIGGEYLIVVQATDEFKAADDWLYSAITGANLVSTRVYNGEVPETVSIPAGTLWVTYRWVRNAQPDTFTMGPAQTRQPVSHLVYEVLVWVQAKSYDPASATAAALRPLLDVAQVATTGGTILGAQRYGPARGYYERETA